jgi:methionine-rich copper-binding protein CopC
MATLSRSLFAAAVAVIMVAIAGCSDDSSPTQSNPDNTPPAVTTVTPVDMSHVDIAFNENLRRETAELEENYVIIETTPPPAPASERVWSAAPGDTLRVVAASLNSDQRTVTITTWPMAAAPYDVSVTGVADANGNEIVAPVVSSFTGVTNPDVTAPEIVYRSPAPNATNVPIGQPVIVQFSEPVTYSSFVGSLAWVSEFSEAVGNEVQTEDGVSFTITPQAPLDTGTLYYVSLSSVEDFAGNVMAIATWSYRTTYASDTTPPTLVSSTPADMTANVNVNTNLSLTFSEAINQVELLVQLIPDPGDGILTWGNGGKTLTFDPDLPLAMDQQYNLTILPGGVRDLAGNGIENPVTIRFTTGSAFETGSFAGTLAGDPNSNYASDPTGALVAAPTSFPFGGDDDFVILGTDVVATNNTYDIGTLPDDVYYPIAVMNTNGDNELDPSTGDAIGAFGANIGMGDFEPDSVTIVGGNRVTGVDFPLFDPSAITGSVWYSGTYSGGSYALWIGVFDAATFDPTEPPQYGTVASWPDFPEFRFNTLDDGLADGQYYVAAYLDVNGNSAYDPSAEPAGIYGTPTVIDLDNGSDAIDLDIVLVDAPIPGNPATRVVWPAAAGRAPWLTKLAAAVRNTRADP